jgi:hypothetical protein
MAVAQRREDRVGPESTPIKTALIVFQMTLPFISDQHLGFRRGTIAMHAKDWKPAASASR